MLYIAYSEPRRQFDLVLPRSHCPHCLSTLMPMDLIPVVSWVLARGKCAYCRQPISKRYPIVEITTCMISLAIFWQFNITWMTGILVVILWLLFVASVIDIERGILPDELTFLALWSTLLGACLQIESVVFPSLESSIIGAVVGYFSFWLIAHLFKWIARRDGIGLGDVKLISAIGAIVGWQLLPVVVTIASVLGVLFGLVLVVLREYSPTAGIRFGPFLFLGTFVCTLWRDEVRYLMNV